MNTATLALVSSALLMTLAAAPAALAQNKKVYRCEDAKGRVTYSDEACRGGSELKNDDSRSDEQRQAAADMVRREEALGDKLARERRAAEKASRPSTAHIAHSAANEAAKADKPAQKAKARKPPKVKKEEKLAVQSLR
jgi:hypothetical protein